MNTESTPHHINAERVEDLVDKYILLWTYTYTHVKHEILHNFEMAESELQRALEHLEDTYKPGKVPGRRNKYDPGDIPDQSAD